MNGIVITFFIYRIENSSYVYILHILQNMGLSKHGLCSVIVHVYKKLSSMEINNNKI